MKINEMDMEILKYLGEEWRDIEGYEGLYKVSSLGRVMRDGKILKPLLRPNGYYQVTLCLSGKRKSHKIHRLVAKAFPEICGEWFDGCEVNHKDEDKSNNAAENLEICDRRYNNLYSHIEKNLHGDIVCRKPIIAFKDGLYVSDYPSISEASRQLGICVQLISEVLHGEKKTTHGYIFKFKEGTSNTPITSPIPFTSHSPLTYNKEENYEI